MSVAVSAEAPDSDKVFHDTVFMEKNKHISDRWVRIAELYPDGISQPLLPAEFSREQFGQGNHYECFMLTALSTLVRFPSVIQNCFVSKHVRRDGRYTFQFFRGREWVKVEIDDQIPLEEDGELYIRSSTGHWWPLLLEKAYAKFYTGYENLEGCTLQETYHDLTGNPVLNIPIDAKLAKAAGADVTEGHYWLDLAQKIQSGQFVASVLTKDMETESMGIQREQQYGVLEIFSMTGTSSVNDIVIHLHNPFEDEEFIYTGPLNSKDSHWTPKLRAKYSVDDERSIFLPLSTFLKIINSMQLCYASTIDGDATYFDDEWKGETAGGNPTCVTWRKNPLYSVRNTGKNPLRLVVMIKQEDQRRFTSPDEQLQYLQCGVVLVQNTSANAIPTHNVTGNNHKPIYKSLFLNSREVANAVTVPPNSLCYLVPSCMSKGSESKFTIALYRMVGEEYSSLTIKKLSVPEMDWDHPAEGHVELEQKQKDRVDFYVDQETDVHILMHQEKPYSSATGGDAMAQDYMGMYLYDDADRKIGGVHAATNFRETGIVYHLPRSGRYALSVTCPRAKGKVPALITIVASYSANSRLVEAPEDAGMFEDEDDDIDEGEESAARNNPIDYMPVNMSPSKITELPDSTTPFEDKRFMVDNKIITNDPWIHIGDLYPEGKTLPLLPDKLSRDQFEQGEHFECCCLTAFATLVDHHPDVLRNVFVTKEVRKDGRYTFQFHRYGQWVKVEIDDRIPLTKQQTLFCHSPTRHWWPLLLEKACAKFYTLYQNLEGCTLQELYYDFTGCPVMNIPTDLKLAKSAMYSVDDPEFWLELNGSLKATALGGITKLHEAELVGLQGDQTYGILSVISTRNSVNPELSDLLVMIYNPFVEAAYTGPMNKGDSCWTSELRSILAPERQDVIYMPVSVFCSAFLSIQQVHIKGLLVPSWHFNSEWGEGTNGGNPTLVTWRENPLYVVRNNSEEPLQIMAMIGQPDQRHKLHLLPQQELDYIQCGLVLSQCTSSSHLATYLVTGNNHRIVHKGLFIDSRESANLVTVPPKSLSYLVPSAMFRDKSKFLLSYWYQKPADEKQMKLVRLNVDVARHLPAIEHLELRSREKDRVDFLVDVPTDIHILLQQEKPFRSSNGGDAMAEDFIGIYLYDGEDKRIQGVTSATNYREIGIVHHLPASGRYALCATCPRGNGVVPCKVEVVGVESAHVRITDPPDDARELGEVDLDFLDVEPESVPLDDLALHEDEAFKGLLAELKKLHKDPEGNADEISAVENQINDHAHILAKKILGKDRARYLPGRDLDLLNPILDSNVDYMDSERNRYGLKKDPRNATKVQFVEEVLQKKADAIAEKAKEPDILFLDPAPEGIPIQDMLLMGDSAFAASARERMKLKRNPVANASKISALEEEMDQRAHVLAKQLRAKERTFLDPEPEGVPLELLSLNENEAFQELERELRALNRKPRKDAKAIVALENALLDRTNVLARELKENERNIFLDPQPEGVPVSELSLDLDEPFHTMEVERLRLRHEDPRANVTKVKELENALNDRAQELARLQLRKERAFQDPEPFGFSLEELGLGFDDAVVRGEAQLRELRKEPKKNAAAIKATEDEISKLVRDIARKKAALDRAFLDPEPEGRLVGELPLDEDKSFVAMDTKRRQLLRRDEDPSKVKALEEEMNDVAHEIARALNAKERLDYLGASPCGVPLEDLPLDLDQEFRELEAKRQQLKRDPRRKAALEEVEAALNARTEEIARRQLAGDRGYLDPAPAGVPLSLLPVDRDAPFQALEAKRAQLKKYPQRNAKSIREVEDDLNDRAVVLADELKAVEREKFLNPKPNGVPIDDVPTNNDGPFRDMEIQRLLLREEPVRNATAISNLEDAMNERALELAANMLADERAFLDPEPLGIPLDDLPIDKNEEFLAMEAQLRVLRKDLVKNRSAIVSLEREMCDLAKEIAADELEKDRDFLDPEPEGRLLQDLSLRKDKEFHGLEKERYRLKKDIKKNAQKIADLEELMNERAHQVAKALNASERKDYLDPTPRGVPVDDLPLDTDEEFSKLEADRAQLMRSQKKHAASIMDLEDALNLRAEELAQEKLQEERSFMNPEPGGIPLKYLPLDEDAAFHEKEVERLALKAENLRRNQGKIKIIEEEMNNRANELAKEMKLNGRQSVLEQVPKGVPLDILSLDDDMPFGDLEVEYLKSVGDGEDNFKARDLADAMRKRAEDMAAKVKADNRMNLEQNPLGIPLEELPLDSNEEFDRQERKLFELMKEPSKNAKLINDAMKRLNTLVIQMAQEKAQKEREFLDSEPEGRYLSKLPLSTDATFLGLERQRRELKKNPYADEDRVADLEQMLNDRVHELAKKMNATERPNYLAVIAHGLPLSELPLDGDKEFGRLEAERAYLCHDRKGNASQIAKVEAALKKRAEEMAADAVRQDRMFLGDEVEGVRVRHLSLDDDPGFTRLETKRAALKNRDPLRNAKAVEDLEGQLLDRASAIAKELKQELRNPLDPRPLGIPLGCLPLDDDERFHALEDGYRELGADPGNKGKRDEIIDQLNERALELAQEMHDRERCVLDQYPEGVPLSALPLNNDEEFTALETETRALRSSPISRGRTLARLKELEDAMNRRAAELANDSRKAFCDPEPEGIPLTLLGLGADEEFARMEEELRYLRKDPDANKETIKNIEFDLNNRAHEVAKGMLEEDRGYLVSDLCGVPLSALPIGSDPKFKALEVQRAKLRATDGLRDARKIRDLEEKLNERLRVLAEEQKAEDLSGIDREPEGVPLSHLMLHEDDAFVAMVEEIRKLKKDPKRNIEAIEDMRDQMNDRAHEIAQEKLRADRAFLDKNPQGVPLDILPLKTDPKFRKLEAERAKLKAQDPRRNAGRIRDLEAQLNDRVNDLATEEKNDALKSLDQVPLGLPIALLHPHDDLELGDLLSNLWDLNKHPGATSEEKDNLQRHMNDRLLEMAAAYLERDRRYLEGNPSGVPLELLPLTSDPGFHTLEVQRAILKAKDPRRNLAKIADLEKKLNERASQLAEDRKRQELEGLDREPEGIPLSALDPHSNREFAFLVDQLRKMPNHSDEDPRVTQLKDEMNALAHVIAAEMKLNDRAFLDKNPQGVPLDILPLDTDPKFRKLEAERAKLKAQDPRRNGRLILDLENAMADRCHELAADQLREDLTGVDMLPRDIPLELLLPHSDPTFAALVDDLRALKKDPEENADAIETVLCAMNDRADDLAAAQLDRGFLNQAPAGVPLEILPLDSDAEFHAMETARVKLKLGDPRRNAKKIRDLEEEMNARAHELAKDQLAEDLAGVDAAPEGIPLSLLKLTDDGVFASMVPWLRELKKDPEANAEQIRNLEDKMNNRAYELADALLEGDRGYLDAAPEGVPLEELPLTNDDVFALMEVERAKLKAQDPQRNAARVAELELQLNEMAAKLARDVLAEDLKGFASQYEGVATEQLKPHNDREFASLVPELRRLKKEGPKNVLRNHMEEMDNRIREIAKEFLDGDLWFLDKVPEGVPLEYVPLAGDEKFEELRHERAALKADEPRKNADRIKECEDAMKKRSHELARDVRERELDGIERKPYDIPLDCLPLREDPVASKIISRLREAKKGVGSPAGKGAVSKIQDELGERARGLAWDALAGDRGKYLDNNIEGVSLSCLPLDTDPQFHGLEVERAQLKLADPRGNAKRIEDAEERLNDRARELARKQLEDDIAGLDLSSVDMPMDVLRPHRDAEFTDAAVRLRELKKDPRRNEKKIRDLEKSMSERVGELMREVLEGDRAFLDPDPDGVPLSDLPINEDQAFRAKEVKHAELKARDPVKHADAIAALENELNQRAHELALDQLKEDLRDLDDTPQGVPIALLRPHDDASFASSVPMLRRLKKDPTRNAEAIRALENKLEGYVDEMAHDFLRADRDSYLDPAPLGHPTATLPLDKDSEFKTLEARRLELMLDPRRNKEEVAELEEALNARATKLAEEMLRNDRAFLEGEPEGVPLRYMHLDEHRQFHELEVKRAALKAKDPVRNAKAIKDIEDELNDLVHELARDQIAEDLRGVDPAPRGISINLLRPLDDPKFNELVEELRALKASSTVNPKRMHALEAEMNNRAGELAEGARLGCRDKLDPYPEGLPLEKLPLDEDEAFSQIELEMAGLKLADPARNAARVANLAEKLNDRALDIARAVKKKDLEGLEEAPRGIPLALLRPHNDEVFASLANEARGDGSRSRSLLSPAAADALNERARELADQLLQGDRGFLERDPEGIPLSVLPLDTDPVFREVEVERAVLKLSDPRKNADRIASLESRLNDRAHELAQERLSGDRGYLDVELAGVSSADLPLDEDPKFHQMEVERAKLKERDPVSNAYRIRDLEEKLNVRAQELAQRVLEEDLKGIDTEPEDVPLVLLHPHKDPEFASFLPDLRRLKKNSGRNAAPISAVQNKMNDRVHELAREMITEGRNSLDPEPEGVPLGYLPLGTDKQFGELEKKLYALQAAPRRNDGAIANLRERLNDRAHELAKEKIQGDRGFLEPEPEGIPLSDLPLDSDEKFHKMETERAKLKENPAKNSDAIARMEKDLNDRVHEMAKKLKEEVRAFLNTTSYGISKELLPLDKDRNFQGMEQQLRKLGRNPRQNAAAIESLREMLQDRADELGLQMLRGDRPKYLEPEYEGVEPVDVPVDDDKVFTELELERAIVKAKDPQSISDKIEELEGKLRERFHELAKERIRRDRLFLDSEPEGIPLESVPLNDDADFRRLEGQLRKLSRDMRRNGPDISDTRDRLNDRAHELARGVVADDMRCLKDTYRGIPKEDLNLHKDAKFRDLANGRRRAARSRGALPAELTAIEGAMDARACEIADNCINRGRAFLDREPEGMDLADVPLDNDGRFAAMEAERRKRTKDPRSSRRNKDMIRDLEDDMIARSHALALEEFAKMRGFMDQEPEGVPLKEIPLDVDPEFRQAEVARYRMRKDPHHSPEEVAKLEDAMNDRARRLAKAILAKNRGFLDPEPCGVPLAELPLNTDEEFNKLAAERYRLKRSNKKDNSPEVKGIENEMNDRVHALAREHLRKARAFLDPEPEGVPLEDVPLGRDPKFLDMERGLAKLRNDPNASAEALSSLEEDLNLRAHEVAREFLKKERAYLDPEPLGVLVEDLPLNHDPILNALERKRRELKKDPKRNGDSIRGCEDDIHDRVRAIAKEFLDNERRFLDPEPEGLPFSELPVDTDRQFRDLENERRALLKQPALNKAAIEGLEERMKTRVNELAKDTLRKCRAFLDPEPLGVPLDDLPLNTDEKFREMEFRHREMKKKAFVNAVSLEKLEDEMKQRTRELAEELLKKERAFIDQEPEGCLLSELPLNKDKHFHEMEKKLRELKKNPRKNLEEINNLEYDMNDRVHELARRQLSDDKSYLPIEIYGVPVFDLPLNNDPEFHELERQRHNLKKDPKNNAGAIRETEDALNERALAIAEEFVRKERAYLDPEPEGVLLDRVPLNADRKFREMEQDRRRLMKDPNKKLEVKKLEERLNNRAHELARDLLGWQDEDFHESNKHMAEEWPRICELYPEGIRDPVVPEKLSSGDISSASRNASFLAPFIAALGCHRVIIDRLFDSKEHPVNGPYSFIFYDPNSNPVRVEIDDRVPVDANMEPKFTRVPKRSWYPLLLEKAYAKFVGGYSRLDQCTPHETLRDLTGRPVLHIPLDDKLAEAANTGDFRSVKFWGGVAKDLERGDVITCMSNVDAGDGIHPLCSYALFAVIETVKESNDPADIVIKLHNCYFDEPFYSGPLNRNDGGWTTELMNACRYNPSEEEFLYLPQPVFLNNFSSMQRCHINCGDRLSSSGEWNECTSGGNPKFTTFRNNPIYLVENKSSRPVRILAELRHQTPSFSDSDGLNHYHQTGLVLMQSVHAKMAPTPLITSSTHRFIQKGMMLDAREVCSQMELPPSTTCYLIPYTMKRGCHGKFNISVYPGMAKVTLTPLRYAGLKREPLMTNVVIPCGNDEGTRVDFLLNDPCDVHVLLRQIQISDPASVKNGDIVAEEEVMLQVYNEYGINLATTANPSSAREQALIFRAPQLGRYSLRMVCSSKSKFDTCPCLLLIWVAKEIEIDFIPVPPDSKPLGLQTRFPMIPRSAPNAFRTGSRERAYSRDRSVRRSDSLPPIQGAVRGGRGSQANFIPPRRPTGV